MSFALHFGGIENVMLLNSRTERVAYVFLLFRSAYILVKNQFYRKDLFDFLERTKRCATFLQAFCVETSSKIRCKNVFNELYDCYRHANKSCKVTCLQTIRALKLFCNKLLNKAFICPVSILLSSIPQQICKTLYGAEGSFGLGCHRC